MQINLFLFGNPRRIPDDKSSVSEFTPMVDDLYEDGRALLEEENKEGDWELYDTVR